MKELKDYFSKEAIELAKKEALRGAFQACAMSPIRPSIPTLDGVEVQNLCVVTFGPENTGPKFRHTGTKAINKTLFAKTHAWVFPDLQEITENDLDPRKFVIEGCIQGSIYASRTYVPTRSVPNPKKEGTFINVELRHPRTNAVLHTNHITFFLVPPEDLETELNRKMNTLKWDEPHSVTGEDPTQDYDLDDDGNMIDKVTKLPYKS